MSIVSRCYDCDRTLDTADAEYRKYLAVPAFENSTPIAVGRIALCEGCALARDENAEAEEL